MPHKLEETKRKQGQARLPHKQMLWGIGTLIALAFLFVFVNKIWRSSQDSTQTNTDPDTTSQERVVRNPLTGMWLQQAVELPQVFAVMIDNHEEARPQSGIDQAFLVIEAPVEAGIPRMIAFFDANSSVEKIGPVRSARPYFIDWNNEFDALYAHVGGSNEALEKIVSGGTFDLNEFSHGLSFWRASTRFAPYNTYTSTEKLNAFLFERSEAGVAPELLYEAWQFKDAESVDPSKKSSVLIDYWAPVYTVGWKFDASQGRYKRFQAEIEDKTLEGEQIVADNVAIIVTDISVVDAVGRRRVRTIGEGKAWVMQDGTVIEASWKKPSASQRLRFYLGDSEIKMNAGSTWIEVVPSAYDVTFAQE